MLKTFVLLQVFLVLTALSAENDYGQSGRKSVPASEVNGTFRMGFTGRFRGNFSEIKILALGGRPFAYRDGSYLPL